MTTTAAPLPEPAAALEAARAILAGEMGAEAEELVRVTSVARVRRLTVEPRHRERGQGRRVALFLSVQRRWAADLADAPMRDRDLGAAYRDGDSLAGVDQELADAARQITERWRARGDTAPVALRYADEPVARCRVDRVICYVGLESRTLLNMRMRASVRTIAGLALAGGTLLGTTMAVMSFWPIGPAALATVAGAITGASALGGVREAWRRTRPRITVVRAPLR